MTLKEKEDDLNFDVKLLTVQVKGMEEKLDKMLAIIDKIGTDTTTNNFSIKLLEKDLSDIKALNLSYMKQKVDDLITVKVFEGIAGGLAFNKISWIIITSLVGTMGGLVFALFKIISKG